MTRALLVGGTRFMGRHTVEELLTHGYEVTMFTRGKSGNPFADRDGVTHFEGNRNDREALDTEVELVHASEREVAKHDVSPLDFPLYVPTLHLVSTEKLASLGWESTPLSEAVAKTVEEHLESDRTGEETGPDRGTEEAIIADLAD